MHVLHTTEAYIVQTYPHGESNKVFKLLTRNLGMLYARGQSVRELKNRNRYALQTDHLSRITLVKGRETWRITSAQPVSEQTLVPPGDVYRKRILRLVSSLLPVEDNTETLFEIIRSGSTAFSHYPQHAPLIEVLTVLRALDVLGYVARPLDEPTLAPFLTSHDFSEAMLEQAEIHRRTLILRVNNSLEEAK